MIGRDGSECGWPAVVTPTLADQREVLRRGVLNPAEHIHFDNLEPKLETDPFKATDYMVLGPLRALLDPTPDRPSAAHEAELIISNRLDCVSSISHVAPLPRVVVELS